jgi:hypothetical protein
VDGDAGLACHLPDRVVTANIAKEHVISVVEVNRPNR